MDFVFVTVGVEAALASAPRYITRNGSVIVVGMPANGVRIPYDPGKLAALNQKIIGSKMGETRIRHDIPILVEHYQKGRLKLDELITARLQARGDQRGDCHREERTGPAQCGDLRMKIAEARTFVTANPPPHVGGRYFIFVKLVTDGGVVGYGEAYSAAFGPHLTARMIEDVAERYLIGHDPHDIETFFRRAYSSGFSQRPDPTLMGCVSRPRNGVLGHHRQRGGQTGLQAARRKGA